MLAVSTAGHQRTSRGKALSGEDIAALKRRFLAVNRERLSLAENAMSPRQQVFLELLPFLFHVNHPALPGFVSASGPAGVSAYSPTDKTVKAAMRVARSFDYKRKVPRQYPIEAIFLMGSAGTIAYSKHSDFDIWLCHRRDLSPAAIGQLEEKADKVTAWAEGLGLEVHFFVLRAEDVKAGRLGRTSSESSGSAQRHLLLDEFYRTALLVAGRFPIWWLVPPNKEGAYEAYTKRLLDRRFVKGSEVVDFGELASVPAAEFFGASLWQLYKAMASPYKSVLKILLLEIYASEFPHLLLLSHLYKKNVYQGRVRPEDLDPYVLMFRKVEQHLGQEGDQVRLGLAREAFYYRVRHHLATAAGEDDWRRDYVRGLHHEWAWDERRVRRLASRDGLRLEQVLAERTLLMNALMRSYRFLSSFARDQNEMLAISQEDMTILGRRLFAAFERKGGKVHRVIEGVTRDLYEPHLQVRLTRPAGRESWLLQRGGAQPDGDGAEPLYRAFTLVGVLAWCHFNSIVQESTLLAAGEGDMPVTTREINAIATALRRKFPQSAFAPPGLEQLSQPSHPVSASLFVNIGINPLAEYARRGEHLTSERGDPFNYASHQTNLVHGIDFLYVTNWGEVFVFNYSGTEGVRQCLMDYLGARREAKRYGATLELTTHCFSSDRSAIIASRVGELFDDVGTRLPGDAAGRYILKMGNAYHLIAREGEEPVHRRLGEFGELLTYLSRTDNPFTPLYFDRFALARSPLPTVYAHFQPGELRHFYYVSRDDAYVYVLDEGGALFHEVQPFHQETSLVNQFGRFFRAVDYRESAGAAFGSAGAGRLPVSFFRLERGPDGGFTARRVNPPVEEGIPRYGELEVITQRIGDAGELSISYGGRDFSTLEHGKDLFAKVAAYILAQRRDRESYPIYITDLDLSGVRPANEGRSGRQRTIHYLHYKGRIEKQLNAVLASREGSDTE